MKCPDCQNELKPVDCKGIVIHECVGCKGKWFERNELQRAKNSADDDLRWLDFDPFGEDAERLSVATQGRMCPECSRKMSSLKYMESQVTIDKCSTCKGVWLDPGELAKIIRYLEKLVNAQSVEALAKDTFKEFINIFTGHKGVISETKDFFTVLNLLQLRIIASHPDIAETSEKLCQVAPFK